MIGFGVQADGSIYRWPSRAEMSGLAGLRDATG